MAPKASERDTAWLRGVMARYEGPLVRYAARILRDEDRGRDVAQETFLRLIRTDNAPDDDRLGEWLFAVCRNRAIDVYRKERRMYALSDEARDNRPSAEPSPPAAAERNEAVGEALHALADLPDNLREVLRLRFQNGFSYKQIAGITGLSVSNVGFLIHTGVGKLRKRFRLAGLLGPARERAEP